MKQPLALAAAIGFLVVAAGAQQAPGSNLLGELPASFEGELPCADCPGIFYHLDLLEERVFFLRATYLGRGANAVFDTVGSWTFEVEGRHIVLSGTAPEPMVLLVLDAKTLRKLDRDAREIDSSLNYNLRRKDAMGLIEPRLNFLGILREDGTFEDCASNRLFSVAGGRTTDELQHQLSEVESGPGLGMLVALQGTVSYAPPTQNGGPTLRIRPERTTGTWPATDCRAPSQPE